MNDFYGANMENRIKYKKVAESGSVRGFDNIEVFFSDFPISESELESFSTLIYVLVIFEIVSLKHILLVGVLHLR